MARSKVERSRRGKPLLSGESDPVAEPCGAGGGQALGRRCGRKGLRPLQPWRARAPRRCGVPTRLRRVARQRAGPARPRIDDDQAFVGFDETRDKVRDQALEGNFQLPKNYNPVTILTHTPSRPRRFVLRTSGRWLKLEKFKSVPAKLTVADYPAE